MSEPNIVLRRAVLGDGALLYEWRMDPATRAASHQTGDIDFATHMAWLSSVLDRTDRDLYVAEEDGVPVGTVRIDRNGDACELSWTVAPAARGRGIGARMVGLVAGTIPDPIRAEVKDTNRASVRIAEAAGMTFVSRVGCTLHFRRGPLAGSR